MKKLLSFLLGAPIVILIIFIGKKFHENPTMKVPYPYYFEKMHKKPIQIEAPVLIIGDRMGQRLSNFAKLLSDTISEDLSTPIKVASIASNAKGIHRSLQTLKSLTKLPLFIIYIGGGQETYEKKFKSSDIPTILKNFSYYNNDWVRSLLMIYPDISRLIYKKMNRQMLKMEVIADSTKYNSDERMKRNEIEFYLYKYHLQELFTYVKEHNSAVIAISHPINLDVAPKQSCPGTIDEKGLEKLNKVTGLIKAKDFKGAFRISQKLSQLFPSNARVQYLSGMIAKKLGKINVAKKSLIKASAYDCKSWRATAVYNNILKQVANENQIFFYDLNKYLQDKWTQNITFEDEIYPQNYYMEKVVKSLGGKIRKVLKL